MRALFHLSCFVFVLLGSIPTAVAQSRIPITIENNSGSVLTNYSVRVELNATNAPGFDFNNNGDDLLASNIDFTTALDFFVESVDPVTQTAVVWIEVPSVPVSPPNTGIFLDYNRSDVPGPLSDLDDTFPTTGFKYHTQANTAANPGPESFAEGEAAFDFDTVAAPGSGYGCTDIQAFPQTGATVENSNTFGSNEDIAFFVETMFSVPAGALYGFRVGPDFGQGGEVYIDDVTLDANWGNDLWWANNYANADVLEGTRFLNPGFHSLKVLGFERCCDGLMGIQYIYDSDGDGDLNDETYADLTATSPGISVFAPSCPVANVALGPITTVPVTLSKFSSSKAGPFLRLEWQTADETFNAGFDFWTLAQSEDGEEELRQLNKKMIRSNHFDSLSTQNYTHQITLKEQIANIVISSVDISGQQEFFGPFEIGENYGADFVTQAIDWQALQAEFQQSMLAKGYVRNKNRWRKASKSNDASASALVTVEQDGIHRVTYADLISAGIDLNGAPKKQIAVTFDGKGIPRRIGGKGNTFGPGSFIDFVGAKPLGENQIYLRQTIYEIGLDRNEVKPVPVVKREPENPQDWRYQSHSFGEDLQYTIASPTDSPWFNEIVFRSSTPVTKSYKFQIANAAQLASAEGSVQLDLAGLSNLPGIDQDNDGIADPDHLIEVRLNGTVIAALEFEGQRSFSQSISFTPDLLRAGENSLELTAADNGYMFDATGIDAVTINYAVHAEVPFFHQPEAAYDGLIFDKTRGSKRYAYAYRLDGNLIRLAIRKASNERGKQQIPFVAEGGSMVFLGTENQFLKAAAIEAKPAPTELNLVDADLLVIAHPHFTGAVLDDYLQQRYLAGVSSQVISTDTIANNFGVGVPVHEAIKRFLIAADSEISFDSVLLVGGHSYDYRNIQNAEAVNFIPSFYRSIGFSRFTPSDQPFVDFDNDGYPEKRIGRWPVRSLADLDAITSKSLAWAATSAERKTQGHSLLLLADRQRIIDFDTDLESQYTSIERGELALNSSERVFVDDYDANPNLSGDNLNALIQEDVKTAIQNGASWLIYNGHGSPSSWSATAMLSSQSISALENEDSPFAVTSLACYTSYYEQPSNNTLAHQLMFGGNNGAAMVHGPSVVGGYENQLKLSELILQNSAAEASIGDAVFTGMNALPVNYSNAILNWAVLADPTLPVQ